MYQGDDDYTTLRDNELQIVSGVGDYDFIYYDLRKATKLQAGLSIGTTIFVCVVLASGALLFSNTATDLVISPIE